MTTCKNGSLRHYEGGVTAV